MEFCIDKSILGTDFHFLCTPDGSQKLEELPKNIPIIGSEALKVMSVVLGLKLPNFPPVAYSKTLEGILDTQENVPWHLCMPEAIYQDSLKSYIQTLKNIFFELDTEYYDKYFCQSTEILENLNPVKIDRTKLIQHMAEASGQQKALLMSFQPTQGYANPICYSKHSSLTGRLTVKSGPQILLLKRDYRDIMVSRFGDQGSIVYIDYKSLEPRVLLVTNKLNDITPSMGNVPLDLYEHMMNELCLPDSISRDIVKTAVISELYGATKESLCRRLKDEVKYPMDFVEAVSEYFKIEEVREKLSAEYLENDREYITSFYGRPIYCENTPPSTLLNYYVQSTAVDVALLGFQQMKYKLATSGAIEKIVPIFILHDALLLDVHNDLKHLLPKLAKVGNFIPKMGKNKFFLDISDL